MSLVSDIKLIRTDTTLDLSQKAEKGMNLPCHPSALYISPDPRVPPFHMGLISPSLPRLFLPLFACCRLCLPLARFCEAPCFLLPLVSSRTSLLVDAHRDSSACRSPASPKIRDRCCSPNSWPPCACRIDPLISWLCRGHLHEAKNLIDTMSRYPTLLCRKCFVAATCRIVRQRSHETVRGDGGRFCSRNFFF